MTDGDPMAKQSARLRDVDLARGVCMLAVMWGHLMLAGRSNYLVYAFHIPTFFLLSGLVFRREKYQDLMQFLRRRVKTLLLPYAIFSVVTWIWWIIDLRLRAQPVEEIWRPLLQTVIAQGSAGYLVHNVALWFVPCLFVVELLYWFLSRLPDWAVAAGAVLSGVIGWLLLQITSVDVRTLPWSVDVAFCALPYYAAGNLLARHQILQRMHRYVDAHRWVSFCCWLLCQAALLLGSGRNGHVSMAQGIYGQNMLLFFVTSVFGILSVLIFCQMLDGFPCSEGSLPGRCRAALAAFGRCSFDVMAVHIPVMLIAARIVTHGSDLDIYTAREQYRYTIPAFLLMLMICVCLLPLIEAVRNRLRRHALSAR